jgi:soluble lytic murein transglycosylase-like protein
MGVADALDAIAAGDCDASTVSDDPVESALVAVHAARCHLAAGAMDAALARWQQVVDSGVAIDRWAEELGWLPELRARIALLGGRPDEAEARFASLVDAADEAPTSRAARARALYYLGLARAARDGTSAALADWERLAREFPDSEYVSRVALALPAGDLASSPSVALAARALAGRHYEAADSILLAVICRGLAPCTPHAALRAGREEAVYQLGFLRVRFRREIADEALPWLEAVVAAGGLRAADAAWAVATALQRVGRRADARRAWATFAAGWPGDSRAGQAPRAIASLLGQDGLLDEAASAWDAIAARAGVEDRAEALRWAAWALRRAGRCADAIHRLDLLDRVGVADASDHAAYWRGVCAATVGDRDRAEAEWTRVAASRPGSWYALLAQQRLGWPATDAAAATLPPLPRELASLAQLGLRGHDGAARVLARARGVDVPAPAGLSPAQQFVWDVAVRPGPSVLRAWLPRRGEDAASALWAAPPFWADAIGRSAEEWALPAPLLWGVIRQESVFDRHALSVSDAMGLMQVIPQTALRIAVRRGVIYRDGDLFEPHVALAFGGWYLAALRAKFGGQLPVAVGAYNAGPILMEAWIDRFGDAPLDDFVESIPADQARQYIMRVTAHAAAAARAGGDARIVGDPELGGLLPLRIRRGYTDGVQF